MKHITDYRHYISSAAVGIPQCDDTLVRHHLACEVPHVHPQIRGRGFLGPALCLTGSWPFLVKSNADENTPAEVQVCSFKVFCVSLGNKSDGKCPFLMEGSNE